MFKLIQFFLITSLFLLSSVHATENIDHSEQLVGAACFISDDQDRVLVIKETISRKFALPGGYINRNEAAKDAAKRETLEETGIVVDVLEELSRTARNIVYACRAKTTIPIYNIDRRFALLPFWKASFFGKEVAAVLLIKPSTYLLFNSRYPDQTTEYFNFLKRSQSSKTEQKENFVSLSNLPFLYANDWSVSLQSWVENLPQYISGILGRILESSVWLGSLNFFIILLPFTIAMKGVKCAVQLIFGFILALYVINLGQMIFEIPQPRHIYPELIVNQNWSEYAFLKSGSVITFSIWGIVYFWLRPYGKSAIYICLFPGILTSFCYIYLGISYWFEIIIGAILGMVIAFAAVMFYQKEWLYKSRFWGLLAAIMGFSTFYFMQPMFLYFTVFSLTYSSILFKYGHREVSLSSLFNKTAFILSFLMMPLIYKVFEHTSLISNSKIFILSGQSISIMLLSIWLMVITPRIASQ